MLTIIKWLQVLGVRKYPYPLYHMVLTWSIVPNRLGSAQGNRWNWHATDRAGRACKPNQTPSFWVNNCWSAWACEFTYVGSIFKHTIYPIWLAGNCLILYWFCFVGNPSISFCSPNVALFPGLSTLTDICACGLAGSSFGMIRHVHHGQWSNVSINAHVH